MYQNRPKSFFRLRFNLSIAAVFTSLIIGLPNQLLGQEAAAAGGPVLVGCTQEAPLFEETRAELGPETEIAYTNIRERAGWSDDAIVQIAAVTVVFNSLNRLADGLGLAADDGFFKSAGERLATKGYGGTADMLGVR